MLSGMKPIFPERDDPGARSHQTLVRSIISLASAHGGGDALSIGQRRWPHDKAVHDYLQRGSVVPTSTTNATQFTSTIVNTLAPLLGPLSASGNIFKRALNLSFDGAAAISLPEAVPNGSGVGFVAQGAPFAVRELSYSSELLTPKKIILGTAGTRELFEGVNSEPFIAKNIAADFSLGLETIMFDATASDTIRPAGLKNGISALNADAGTGIDGMFADLATLGAAVSVVGGMNFCYVANPTAAIKIALRRSTNNFPYPVYASSALTDEVCCLAFDALAVAGGDGVPRFETSKVAAVHMSTTPTALSVTGTPPVVAAPSVSLFQHDLIAVKLICDLSWVLRSASGFAWIAAVNW